jgi:hypothetical protein
LTQVVVVVVVVVVGDVVIIGEQDVTDDVRTTTGWG